MKTSRYYCHEKRNENEKITFTGYDAIMLHKLLYLSSNEVMLIYELKPLVNLSLSHRNLYYLDMTIEYLILIDHVIGGLI